MQSRKTGDVTQETLCAVKSVNRLLDVFNHYHFTYRNAYLIDELNDPGAIFIIAPTLLRLIEKINLGNLLNVVPELEWVIASIYSNKQLRFEYYPEDITMPCLKEDVVTNPCVLELLTELLVIVMSRSNGDTK